MHVVVATTSTITQDLWTISVYTLLAMMEVGHLRKKIRVPIYSPLVIFYQQAHISNWSPHLKDPLSQGRRKIYQELPTNLFDLIDLLGIEGWALVDLFHLLLPSVFGGEKISGPSCSIVSCWDTCWKYPSSCILPLVWRGRSSSVFWSSLSSLILCFLRILGCRLRQSFSFDGSPPFVV